MKAWTALLGGLLACGGPGGSRSGEVPEGLLFLAPEPAAMARTTFEVFLLGERIGTEEFAITKRASGHRLDLDARWDGEAWTLKLDVDPRWQVESSRLVKHAATGERDACELHMRLADGHTEVRARRDGAEWLANREEGRSSWVVLRPIVTQHAVCARATDRAVTLNNFPAFRVELAPRRALTLADGRTVDHVRVDDLLDIYCLGADLVMAHYGKHGFLATRADFTSAGRALAKDDPTDEPWAGPLACPARPTASDPP